MSDANVTYELVGNVALVGLDRSGKRNALNDEMIKLLREAVFRAGEEARAGVIHAIGDNFSAGLDLAEALSWMDPNASKEAKAKRNRRGRWHRSFDLIARGPIPWVAALKGACIGGGLELASACHIRVADETHLFCTARRPARHLRRRRRLCPHLPADGLCAHGRPDVDRPCPHG